MNVFNWFFTINNEGDNFEPPKFPSFKAEGPFINRGNQTAITIVNGKVTQKEKFLLKLFTI